jgi:hypothetical protein
MFVEFGTRLPNKLNPNISSDNRDKQRSFRVDAEKAEISRRVEALEKFARVQYNQMPI